MDTLEGVGNLGEVLKYCTFLLVKHSQYAKPLSHLSLSLSLYIYIYIWNYNTYKPIIESIYESHNSLHIIVLMFSKSFSYKLPFGLH